MVKKLNKRHLLIVQIVLLVFITIPINGIAAEKKPIIHLLTLNNSSVSPVKANPGKITYSVLVESFSQKGKAKVNFYIVNTKTNERITVFKDQWLKNQMNTGSFNIEAGIWEATVTAVDEDGNEAPPVILVLEVGDVEKDKVQIISVNPDPILVESDNSTVNVKVTYRNTSAAPIDINGGWRWKDETKWQGVKKITIPPANVNGGDIEVVFQIPINLKQGSSREIVFTAYSQKLDDETNKTLMVQLNLPDLRVNKIVVKGINESNILVDIEVEQVGLIGRKDTIHTTVVYGFGSQVTGEQSVSLAPGQSKWITGVSFPKQVPLTVFAEINPTRTQPAKEVDIRNNKKFLIINYMESGTNFYTSFVSGGTYHQGDEITTLVKVGNIPNSIMEQPVDVVLRHGSTQLGRQQVHLRPGEEKVIYFKWTPEVKSPSAVEYEIEAEINPEPRKQEEITYEDNIAKNTLKLLPNFLGKFCTPDSNNTSAASGYYEELSCDEDGSCFIIVKEYREQVSIKQTESIPQKVKAGMGFTFEVNTSYYNENPHQEGYTKKDFQKVYADFPEKDEIELIAEKEVPNSSNKWIPPRAKIARGQGDLELVEYIHTKEALKLDPTKFVDGKNKHYTSFYLKDGDYSYRVYGEGAGIDYTTYTDVDGITTIIPGSPKLSFCNDRKVKIEGSPHDDYVIRRIDPNNPFPQSDRHGWNWKGKTNEIDQSKDWWNTMGKSSNPYESKWILKVK